MSFVKGHGTENDFVVLPDPQGSLALPAALVRALCDRRAGLGADGVLRVVPTALVPEVAAQADVAPWFMDYRNADGSLAEMCGNGIRVYVRYLVDTGLVAAGPMQLATRGGPRRVTVPAVGDVSVDMGRPEFPDVGPVTVEVAGHARPTLAVSMGNPHVVVAVDSLADAGDLRAPPVVAPAGAFPAGTNVEFVVVPLLAPAPQVTVGRIAMRVFERGVGETRSCGTGACAAVAAVMRWADGGAATAYDVDVPGGTLRVCPDADGRLHLSGPAVLGAAGELRGRWLSAQVGD
jgi:diaminopimelate epimerase